MNWRFTISGATVVLLPKIILTASTNNFQITTGQDLNFNFFNDFLNFAVKLYARVATKFGTLISPCKSLTLEKIVGNMNQCNAPFARLFILSKGCIFQDNASSWLVALTNRRLVDE